jgi:hypothetical protein
MNTNVVRLPTEQDADRVRRYADAYMELDPLINEVGVLKDILFALDLENSGAKELRATMLLCKAIDDLCTRHHDLACEGLPPRTA